jgi:hypothetical protein
MDEKLELDTLEVMHERRIIFSVKDALKAIATAYEISINIYLKG